MARISSLDYQPLIGPKGKSLGRVSHVLFHPREPRVVGLEVKPRPLLYVIERRPRYISLDQVELAGDRLSVRGPRPKMGAAAEKALGFSWEETVIWHYMPVITADDVELGFVRDVDFDFADGAVKSIVLSDGLTTDVAVGTAAIEADQVEGFDGSCVRVKPAVAEQATSGGVATSAGMGAAVAKVAAEQVARTAVKGAVKAARIAKSARSGELGKRASDGWRTFKDSIAEGMREEDDD